ncbi:MAG: T9SS type A sorting domain-containing protein [Bacteroidetes bacterium]|nr:T9SS type A sorting domain-containing protein [Bacteroidota bacterium]MBU2586159.1 T9SS type A sorting domain-containing protein [Bacteroidota bacterium]
MKNFLQKSSFLFLLLILISTAEIFSQPKWTYRYKIDFPPTDTAFVQPYLCAIDQNKRLYVISSKVTNINAHNAIYYADSTDLVFTKMIDFDLNGDSDSLTGNIGALRGIATLKNDVIVNASVPFQRSKPHTVASQYYYKDGDMTQVEKFGFYHTGSGYGTYVSGIDMTKDSIAFTGIFYLTSTRLYNFSYGVTSPGRGSYVPPPNYGQESGGHDGTGLSAIRDVAVLPEGDYNNTETPWYTSRNSNPPMISGGIGLWAGGTQASPGTYSCQRVNDATSLLIFDRTTPNGITVDKNNRLWVAGTDSTRRWVKAFDMLGNFAMEFAELPSQNSGTNPDPTGAPMMAPSDVALTSDALTAYLIDAVNRCAYKFQFGEFVGVEDEIQKPFDFVLEQNYPNPFNPSTFISFTLPKAMNVKLVVTNSLGQKVETLVDGFLTAGKHIKVFDASAFSGLSSGVYYYTLITEINVKSKKMLLIR